jgi:3-oxoacid CoA-transferase
MAAQEFKTGMNCNLGVGTPTMAAGFAASTGTHAFLQSENGMTDWKTYPEKNQEDSDRISVERETVAALPSFGQIRGGQWDLIVLGVCKFNYTNASC